MANEIQSWLVEKLSVIDNDDGSPIETLFRAGLMFCAQMLRLREDGESYRLGTQEKIGPYRVDFVLEAYSTEVIIEVDGHEWHEKTKEQAARDKARDRYLVAHRYTIIRFTGSEVYANPFKCAEEAFSVARAIGIMRRGT